MHIFLESFGLWTMILRKRNVAHMLAYFAAKKTQNQVYIWFSHKVLNFFTLLQKCNKKLYAVFWVFFLQLGASFKPLQFC